MVQYYEVIAPLGAPVKDGCRLGSAAVGRLSVAATVTIEEKKGTRLRYKKASGSGPEGGWISLELLELVESARKPETFQGNSILYRAEAQVLRDGAKAALTAASPKSADVPSLAIVAVAQLTLGAGDEALEAANQIVNRSASNDAHKAAGLLLVALARLGKHEARQSAEAATQAIDIFRRVGDKQMVASGLSTLANARLASNQAAQAVTAAKEALGVFREINDKEGEAAAELTLTDAYIARDGLNSAGTAVASDKAAFQQQDTVAQAKALQELAAAKCDTDSKEALRLAKETVALVRQVGVTAAEASALTQLAIVQLASGQAFADAEKNANEALSLSTNARDKEGQAAARLTLARVLAQKGETTNAGSELSSALSLYQEIGGSTAARASKVASGVYVACGNGTAALEAAAKAQSFFHDANNPREEAEALLIGARAHLLQGGTKGAEEAVQSSREALSIFQSLGDRRAEATTWQVLATALMNTASGAGEAASAAERARAGFLLLGDPQRQGLASHAVAQCCLKLGEVDLGLQAAMQGVVLAQEAGDQWGEAAALHTATHAVVRKGHYAEGLRMAREVHAIFRKLGAKQMEEAAEAMVRTIQEGLPSRAQVPRSILEPQDAARIGFSQDASLPLNQDSYNTIIWNAPTHQVSYLFYGIELLKLVDDLKNRVEKTTLLIVTQGAQARQTGQIMPGNQYHLGAAVMWGAARTIRLESPKTSVRSVDIPLGASVNEITQCLRAAQIFAGPRDEIGFIIDRENKLSVNKQ